MRILFVENRQKTWFWDAIASRLAKHGHKIHWVRQSPVFAGRTGLSHLIPLPHARDSAQANGWFDEVRASDRNCRYFGGSPGHYPYYRDRLSRVLDDVRPNAVIGEATLFHELMLAKLCRDRGIDYLHPTNTRYPEGRFFVFRYDSQRAVAESGDAITDGAARNLAEAIAQRATAPYYMRTPDTARALRKQVSLRMDHVRILAGWLMGERFNTPAPWRRIAMTREMTRRLDRWDQLARPLEKGARAILYPLQMQPECNIDVWGRGFNDQAELIAALLRSAPPDVSVAVKGNPKAKYEVSDTLLRMAAQDRRLIMLPRSHSMAEAQGSTLGSVTVTGTVGFEAIFGAARCFSLAHPLITDEFPSFAARDVPQAVERVLGSPDLGRGDVALGIRLIKRVVQQSFPGFVSDPTSYPEVMQTENLDSVASSLMRVLASDLHETVHSAPFAAHA